jgi:lysophospholipase L1-like esterase
MPARPLPWPLRLVLGLVVAALVLTGLELGLRLVLGPPDPPILVAPRWHEQGPAFLDRGGLITPAYQRRNHVEPFPAAPTPGRPRVFFLGGSSLHGGSRLEHEQELPGQVQALLDASGQDVEVVNLAQSSLDSHSVRLIVDQALPYGPDLLVLYLGHNDLGNTTMEARYQGVAGALEARAQVLLRRLALYELLVASASETLPPLQADRRDRWEAEPLTPAQRTLAAAGLQDNLAHIVHKAREQGVAVLLITPISELSQQAPTSAACPEHEHLTRSHAAEAWAQIDAALATQPDCNKLLWFRGKQRLTQGLPGACEDLWRANDLDPRPLTASEPMADAIRRAASLEGATLLDLRAQLRAEHCVPPTAWFIDSVHFSAEGHRALAERVTPQVLALLGR